MKEILEAFIKLATVQGWEEDEIRFVVNSVLSGDFPFLLEDLRLFLL